MKLPQLALRDLFWLVALVAMCFGWWLDQTETSSEARYSRRVSEILMDRLSVDCQKTVTLHENGVAVSDHQGESFFGIANHDRRK